MARECNATGITVAIPSYSLCPAVSVMEIADDISARLISIFVPDANGHRPVHGGVRKLQDDPHWRNLVLFYEYFHGDNGAGIGASHQTGWTGLVAPLISFFGTIDARAWLELGREGVMDRNARERTAARRAPAHT